VAHNRTNIRNALVALVGPALNPVALLSERRNRIDSALRPLVILSLGDDTFEPAERSMGSPVYAVEHSQAVTFEIHTEADTGEVAADDIDSIELTIEAALSTDLKLGGLVEMVFPVGSALEMETTQDRVIAVRSVNYQADWRSAFGSPDDPEA
jgi:hypothetical protein